VVRLYDGHCGNSGDGDSSHGSKDVSSISVLTCNGNGSYETENGNGTTARHNGTAKWHWQNGNGMVETRH